MPNPLSETQISIHAPRVGRDYGQAYLTRYAAIFQSTRPVWGATPKPADAVFCPVISIHAPRVGRDYTGADGRSRACHFNPRAPCGARPKYVKTTTWLKRFQSTRPVWGATMVLPFVSRVFPLFQSTRPVWGATANLTILPRQICTKGTKEFLLGRKTHGKKEK